MKLKTKERLAIATAVVLMGISFFNTKDPLTDRIKCIERLQEQSYCVTQERFPKLTVKDKENKKLFDIGDDVCSGAKVLLLNDNENPVRILNSNRIYELRFTFQTNKKLSEKELDARITKVTVCSD